MAVTKNLPISLKDNCSLLFSCPDILSINAVLKRPLTVEIIPQFDVSVAI
jgi:hypothetical protein